MCGNHGGEGDSWGEQNIIDAWLKKHDINLPHKDIYELKKAVTKLRVEQQERAESAEKIIKDVGESLTGHKCTSICTEHADGHTTPNELEKQGVPCLHCKIKKIISDNE